ncbi:MAG: ATP-binding protein [Chloroflexota bacterium]
MQYFAYNFPFTAIVGQERMQRALILNAIDSRIGGVLIRGERGTAKSTAARALAALLPDLRVIEGCRFGCDPDRPMEWCTECRQRFPGGAKPPVITRPTPFVNLPISATEDRVVGTLDIEKAIQKGEKAFEPGVLAAANRGLLYIDEVNLLDDHVVDVLLDSAAMGVNIVEREGVSFSHPARFILVGTMNPEEGDLRPQLLDRFGLSVQVQGLRNALERVAIMKRRLAYEENAEAFCKAWQERERELGFKIQQARRLVQQVEYSRDDLMIITQLTAHFEVDGHRPDMVILKAARAQAAFEERSKINRQDIAIAAEFALPHRLRHSPFEQQAAHIDELRDEIETLLGLKAHQQGEQRRPMGLKTYEEVLKEYADPNNPLKDFVDTGLR